MAWLARLRLALAAGRELGVRPLALYGLYRFGLRSGYWRRCTPARPDYPSLTGGLQSPPAPSGVQNWLLSTPQVAQQVSNEAAEICAGQVRLFGGGPRPLALAPAQPLQHWSAYEQGRAGWGAEDPKLIWEPARFGWVFTLGRSSLCTTGGDYAACFWQQFEHFLETNPPNQGPNWASAQEVALRLVAWLYAAWVFAAAQATTPQRIERLRGAVALHAQRILATLVYARSQNNNHLLTEALGLYAAGLALADVDEAAHWRESGWRWLHEGLQNQIEPDGTYSQHASNYHRLMLQTALWAWALAARTGQTFPPASLQRLAAATRWLLAQLDPLSGRVSNLGSNDGAYILPLAAGGFCDYRPVIQAAGRVFLGQAPLLPGDWDEFSLWLEALAGQPLPAATEKPFVRPASASEPYPTLGAGSTWASLRAVQFRGRPAHADQLHVELWWRGHNLAGDAGTYRYTAPAPWDNALAHTGVHNTITIDHQAQMRRAGRFLWLERAQARLLAASANELVAAHDGYERRGVRHIRYLRRVTDTHWQIYDLLTASERGPAQPHTCCLHWLLPDWPWRIDNHTLTLTSPEGSTLTLALTITSPTEGKPVVQIIRSGLVLYGPHQPLPIFGWRSDAYDERRPALSLRLSLHAPLPVELSSNWILPEDEFLSKNITGR